MKLWWGLAFLVALAGCQSPSGKPFVAKPPVTSDVPVEPERLPFTQISMRAQDRRIPVIMYHDVIVKRDRNSQWFDCSVDEFREQMEFLRLQGAVPISVQDLYDHLTNGKEVPETAVVLTFDDNYQGVYDNAYPVLKEYGYPFCVFVHTAFVGKTEGLHPKMSYATLNELLTDATVSVGSHTVTHPDDLSKLDVPTQEQELQISKQELEQNLSRKIDFLAYPNGKNDAITQGLAEAAGYKMSFSIVNGLAEESPSIQCVSRYVHTRLEKAWEDRQRALDGGGGGAIRLPLKSDGNISLKIEEFAGVRLAMITGGTPETATSETRESVLQFIQRTGAQAGINGTFFAMAAIKSTDNRLVGPCKTPDMPEVIGDSETTRWEKLRNRPVVLWSKDEIAFVPFQPETMKTDAPFKDFMPEVTNVFMGGAWLVRGGVPLDREKLRIFGSRDVMDARRRAALGVNLEGQIVCAATRESASSAQFATALAEAGISNAVLLDSGFSTSLVFGEKIIASGHSTASEPSRPVPHVILLRGMLDEASQTLAQQNELRYVPESGRRRARRR